MQFKKNHARVHLFSLKTLNLHPKFLDKHVRRTLFTWLKKQANLIEIAFQFWPPCLFLFLMPILVFRRQIWLHGCWSLQIVELWLQTFILHVITDFCILFSLLISNCTEIYYYYYRNTYAFCLSCIDIMHRHQGFLQQKIVLLQTFKALSVSPIIYLERELAYKKWSQTWISVLLFC